MQGNAVGGSANQHFKLLLSCYACEPNKGSELGIGWNTAWELSKYHDVWVLAKTDFRSPIEAYLKDNPNPHLHFTFVDLPRWIPISGAAWNGRWGRPHYHLWQHTTYGTAAMLHKDIQFDATMHVTYGSYWRPSFLRRLPVPFIWGPVGGAENIPPTFYDSLDEDTIRWDRSKRRVEGIATALDPTVAATARKSAIALVPTPTTEQKVRQLGAKRTILVPQMALPSAELAKFRDFPIHQNRTQVRFLSMGRILGWKGLRLAVQAFAKLVQRYPNAEYWHDGDGEMGAELVTLAQELGIADKFRLIEGNTRSQALENLANADVVLFPCLHDEPGWVVVEAMAAARPVIYVMGRPATPGAEETGVSSNATTAEQAVEDLANAMFRLANDPALRRQMGEAARAHAWQYFNYEARGVLYSNLIHEVVTTHRSKAK